MNNSMAVPKAPNIVDEDIHLTQMFNTNDTNTDDFVSQFIRSGLNKYPVAEAGVAQSQHDTHKQPFLKPSSNTRLAKSSTFNTRTFSLPMNSLKSEIARTGRLRDSGVTTSSSDNCQPFQKVAENKFSNRTSDGIYQCRFRDKPDNIPPFNCLPEHGHPTSGLYNLQYPRNSLNASSHQSFCNSSSAKENSLSYSQSNLFNYRQTLPSTPSTNVAKVYDSSESSLNNAKYTNTWNTNNDPSEDPSEEFVEEEEEDINGMLNKEESPSRCDAPSFTRSNHFQYSQNRS